MKRTFAFGFMTVAAFAVIIVALLAVLLSRAEHHDAQASAYTSCPATTPDACAGRLAHAWGPKVRALPTVAVPAGFRYTQGFITKAAHPPAGIFTFSTTLSGEADPTEITLRVVPASSVPFDAAHRGGTLRHLRNGRAYLDGTIPVRSGPFIERVGDFDVVVGFSLRRPIAGLRTAQLQLLGAVSESS